MDNKDREDRIIQALHTVLHEVPEDTPDGDVLDGVWQFCGELTWGEEQFALANLRSIRGDGFR